jgi:5-oxoprolinase (ATP-hydrolysing) subunit B
MNLHTIFSNFIAIEYLNIDNEQLKNYCKKVFTPTGNFVNLKDLEIQPLLNTVNARLETLHQTLGLTSDTYQEIDRCWVNISTSRAISEPHIHPRRFLIAVYYVSGTKDSGSLTLMNPNPQHDQIIPASKTRNIVGLHNHFNSSRYVIDPEPGKLVIFPGWIQHFVSSGDNSERISIALDSTIFNKDPTVTY